MKREYLSNVETVLKELKSNELEVEETLQSIRISEKLFESQYFRGRLKGVLEDTHSANKKACELIKFMSLKKDNVEKVDRSEAFEEEVMKIKKIVDE